MERGNLIGQGRTAEIFEWGECKILKLFRTGIPKRLVESEYEVSLEIYKQMKLTPEVFELIEIDDRVGIIYEKIQGTPMMKIITSKPWAVKREAYRMAEIHKSMQLRIDFKLPEYKRKLKNEISRTGLLTEDVKSKLYEYIDQLADDNILCHGDFHPDNVLITKDRAVIIDWMTAARGNPLADVARTSIMFKFSDVSEKPYLEKKMINFFRTKFLSEYINHYMDISSAKFEQIEQWELPVAAARLTEGIPDSEKMTLLNFINSKIGLIS